MNTIRFASYNVLNLYDNIDDPGKKDEGTPAKPEAEIEAVASVLRDSQADVVALQEVEKAETLEHLRGGYLKDVYPYSVLIEGNDERGSDVALLSKFPIKNLVSHKDHTFKGKFTGEEMKFKRDLLRADIDVPNGPPVRVYAVHFKSKIGGEAADRVRASEAAEASRLVREESAQFPGHNVVVMGDANDSPESSTGQALVAQDNGWGLKDAMATAGKVDEPTFSTREEDRVKWGAKRIDYILSTPEMNERLLNVQVNHHPQSVAGSDHFMLMADYALS